MNKQNFHNENKKFPLTTDALDFIQKQIELVYQLTNLAGKNVIISEPKLGKDGLVIIDGELLPLCYPKISDNCKIAVFNVENRLELGDASFDGIVSCVRTARYVQAIISGKNVSGQTDYEKAYNVSDFIVLKNISTLMVELEDAKQHHLPKGSIIDWYGECKVENIPYGFVPCGWFGKNLKQSELESELTAWQNKYPNNITITRTYTQQSRLYISACNGVTVPLLTDKFIVQAGHGYSLGDTGGEDKHELLISEIPAHRHVYNVDSNAIERNVYEGMGREESGDLDNYGGSGSGSGGTAYSSYAGAGCGADGKGSSSASLEATSHENRPPYFALYKLIKVI